MNTYFFQIFATLATVAETIVFLYMGMGFFTNEMDHWQLTFSLYAMAFCVIARFMNIFPLSFISNLCRRKSNRITWQMQVVLTFAGLRGAIAFALATNMPGENASTISHVTLTICAITTVVCGGFTERILGTFGMKENEKNDVQVGNENFEDDEEGNDDDGDEETSGLFAMQTNSSETVKMAYHGLKGLWADFDYIYLRPLFGGSPHMLSPTKGGHGRVIGKEQEDG